MKYMILLYGSQQDYDALTGKQVPGKPAWGAADFAAMEVADGRAAAKIAGGGGSAAALASAPGSAVRAGGIAWSSDTEATFGAAAGDGAGAATGFGETSAAWSVTSAGCGDSGIAATPADRRPAPLAVNWLCGRAFGSRNPRFSAACP